MDLTDRLKALGARVRVIDAAGSVQKNNMKNKPSEHQDDRAGKKALNIPIVKNEKKKPSFSLTPTMVLTFTLLSIPLILYLYLYPRISVRSDTASVIPEIENKVANPVLSTKDKIKELPIKVQVKPEKVVSLKAADPEVEKLNREGVDLSKEGRFDEAIERYKEALKHAPDHDVVRSNMENTYLTAGSKVLEEGDFEVARNYFDQALQIRPSAAGFKGRGVAHGKLGNQSSALSDFKSSLEIDDSDESLLLTLAAASYQENDLKVAREYFQRVLTLNPSNAVALQYLSKIKREVVEEDFREKESFHFYVKYEGPENGVAGYLVSSILEEAYQKVGADFGFYPEDMVTAILYTDQSFQDVTRSPSWAGGLYDGKIRIPVGGLNRRTDNLVRVIYHEYAHAVVHRITGGNCPTWLNEGIAQYEEGNATLSRATSYVKSTGRLIPLKYLEGSFMGLDRSMISTAYSMSLLAFNYIENEYGLLTIRQILDEMAEGKRGEEALRSSIYVSYEDIERGVKRRLTDG